MPPFHVTPLLIPFLRASQPATQKPPILFSAGVVEGPRDGAHGAPKPGASPIEVIVPVTLKLDEEDIGEGFSQRRARRYGREVEIVVAEMLED